MAIGLLLTVILLAFFSSSSRASGLSEAQVQMNEDAQFALKIIGSQLRQAGLNPLQAGTGSSPNPVPSFGIFACDTGFASTTASDITLLQCNTLGRSAGAALAVSYEADVYNTIASVTNPVNPTDCLGNRLRGVSGAAIPYYVAENRYFVVDGVLYCAGSGGGGNAFFKQAMVENVERLSLSFGVASPTSNTGRQAVSGYLSAAEIGGTSASAVPRNPQIAALTSPAQRWQKVISVRVCLVMRSAKPVLEQPQAYFGCNPETDGGPISTTDNYFRHSYATTVALRNRVPLP
jgi:type IV pilus assembly protein PilW